MSNLFDSTIITNLSSNTIVLPATIGGNSILSGANATVSYLFSFVASELVLNSLIDKVAIKSIPTTYVPGDLVDGQGAEVIFYVRTTGNDVTGDGSITKPFRTFVHAVDIAFAAQPVYHNLYITIDITGLGVENLPDNYVLPPFYASTPTFLNFLAPDVLDTRREAFNVVAHHGIPLDTIAGVDIVAQTFDPTSKIGIITLGAGHPLVPGALVGKFIKSTVFGFIAVLAPISKNTASTIEIASNFFSFVSFDAPLVIVEPSAELRNNNASSGTDAIRLHGWGGIMFAGVKISHANPSTTSPVAIQCDGAVDLIINGCDLAGIVPGDTQSVASTTQIDNSYVHNKTIDLHFYSLEIFGCFLQNVGSGNQLGSGSIVGVLSFVSDVMDNYVNLSLGGVDGTPGCGLIMRECMIRNQSNANLPDAITLVEIGTTVLTELTCRDNAGSAFAALVPSRTALSMVRGFNNGSVGNRPGIFADNGAHVEVSATVNVTGQLTDTATAGVAASIVAGAATNNLRVSGLAAMVPGDVGSYLKLSGAGYVIHNDTFLIVAVVNATTVDVLMNGITSPLDASNGSIIWVVQTAGVDLQAGTLPVRTWADFRAVPPLKNEFDVPGFPAATAATTTGARIWEI